MCSPSNTGSVFTTYDDNGGYYIRTAPPDSLQGQALGDLVTADGYSEVAVIALNDAYGQGFADAVVAQLEANGANVVANVAYDPNGSVFDADVQQLADAAPEAVVLIAFPDTGSVILQAMIEQGIGPAEVQIYLTDGTQGSEPADQGGSRQPGRARRRQGHRPLGGASGRSGLVPGCLRRLRPGSRHDLRRLCLRLPDHLRPGRFDRRERTIPRSG